MIMALGLKMQKTLKNKDHQVRCTGRPEVKLMSEAKTLQSDAHQGVARPRTTGQSCPSTVRKTHLIAFHSLCRAQRSTARAQVRPTVCILGTRIILIFYFSEELFWTMNIKFGLVLKIGTSLANLVKLMEKPFKFHDLTLRRASEDSFFT